jgi:hypothetical protein
VSLALSFPMRWLNFVFPLYLGRLWKESGGAGRALFRSEMRVDCGANPPKNRSLAAAGFRRLRPDRVDFYHGRLPWAVWGGGEFLVGREEFAVGGRAGVDRVEVRWAVRWAVTLGGSFSIIL